MKFNSTVATEVTKEKNQSDVEGVIRPMTTEQVLGYLCEELNIVGAADPRKNLLGEEQNRAGEDNWHDTGVIDFERQK